jgi:hypothetical protein
VLIDHLTRALVWIGRICSAIRVGIEAMAVDAQLSVRPAELLCTFVLFADVEAIALFAATAIRTGLPAFGADDAAIVIDRGAELRASRRPDISRRRGISMPRRDWRPLSLSRTLSRPQLLSIPAILIFAVVNEQIYACCLQKMKFWRTR